MAVVTHWKHQKFVANLLAASHDKDLAAGAKEWEFAWYGAPGEKVCWCNLCNAQMKGFVVLRNRKNQNLVAIGFNCYDKFMTLVRNKQTASLALMRFYC